MKNASKTKGRYRFNIVDVILLAVIVLSLSAILFLFLYDGTNEKKDNGPESVEIIYTVEQQHLPDILRGKINMGDGVLKVDDLHNLGNVINFQYTDSVYTAIEPETNVAFTSLYPGKIDLSVKISATAVIDESGAYVVNGQRISAGEAMNIRFPYYTGEMVCVSVSEVSE